MVLHEEDLKTEGIESKDVFIGIFKTHGFKNESLYVDWNSENKCILPSDAFTKEKAQRNLKIAEFRIECFQK